MEPSIVKLIGDLCRGSFDGTRRPRVCAEMLASCGAVASGTDTPVADIDLGRYTISSNDLTITTGPPVRCPIDRSHSRVSIAVCGYH
jgi:hypothetical protein